MMTHTEKTRAALTAQLIAMPLLLGIGITIGWVASGDQEDGAHIITPAVVERQPQTSRCGERGAD